ncbi:MAG TPA: DUF4097 family beta strand repeat-containing protein [Bacillota bacterium]|nr:DUF4097 family beta strand repeat-containing protein [Bacillota bacterium]
MSRKFFVNLAIILIVVGIVGSLFTFDFETEAVTKEETFASTDINQIDVNSDNVKVDVLQTEGSEIKVEFTGKQSKQNNKKFKTSVDGDTLRIDLNDKRWNLFDFDFFFTSLALKVYLPEKDYQSLSVESSNGKITAKEVQVKDVKLETDNGKVVGENLMTSTFHAKTSNGKVALKNVDGTIKADTDNGRIDLTTPDLERSVDLKTNNGAIIIHSEQEPENVSFIANTANGSIDIFGKYDGSAVIGNGDHVVQLKTDNGRIRISH